MLTNYENHPKPTLLKDVFQGATDFFIHQPERPCWCCSKMPHNHKVTGSDSLCWNNSTPLLAMNADRSLEYTLWKGHG